MTNELTWLCIGAAAWIASVWYAYDLGKIRGQLNAYRQISSSMTDVVDQARALRDYIKGNP